MTTNPPVQMKVSATGYLCVRNVNSNDWIVCCMLNRDQISDVSDSIHCINERDRMLTLPAL